MKGLLAADSEIAVDEVIDFSELKILSIRLLIGQRVMDSIDASAEILKSAMRSTHVGADATFTRRAFRQSP